MFLCIESQCVSPTLRHSNSNGPTAIVFQRSTIIFFCVVPSDISATVSEIRWYIGNNTIQSSNSSIQIDPMGPALIINNVTSGLNTKIIKCSAVYYNMYPYNSTEVVLLVQGQ